MIPFPKWTESEDLRERAKLRLSYICHYLSAYVSKPPSMIVLAERLGISNASFYYAQRQGRFTKAVAISIVTQFGETGVTVEMLTNPNFDIHPEASSDDEL